MKNKNFSYHRILTGSTIAVSSTHALIPVPDPSLSVPAGNGNPYPEFQYTDKVVYFFDDFTGSIFLVQSTGDTTGIQYYGDTDLPKESGPWSIQSGPKYLYVSGSNSQNVSVTVVLVR